MVEKRMSEKANKILYVPLQAVGTDGIDAGKVYLGADISGPEVGDDGPGAAEGQVQGGVPPAGEHQAPAGQSVLRADEVDGHIGEGPSHGVSVGSIHIQSPGMSRSPTSTWPTGW